MDSTEVTAGTNGTATQYNNLRKDLVLGKNINGTDADAATITIDWSDKTKGKIRTVGALTSNRTIAFSNVTVSQFIILRILQDGTGGRTITWPAGFKWPFNVAPNLSANPNAVDFIGVFCSSGGVYEGMVLGSDVR